MNSACSAVTTRAGSRLYPSSAASNALRTLGSTSASALSLRWRPQAVHQDQGAMRRSESRARCRLGSDVQCTQLTARVERSLKLVGPKDSCRRRGTRALAPRRRAVIDAGARERNQTPQRSSLLHAASARVVLAPAGCDQLVWRVLASSPPLARGDASACVLSRVPVAAGAVSELARVARTPRLTCPPAGASVTIRPA